MAHTPLVSVLLPVYNGEPYLAAALASILRQDHERLEVIAIDDGSTDSSLQILQRYQKADGRISIVSRENRGLIATLNEALVLAKGDLVARMDADDVCYTTRLSRQVSVFKEQPHLAICGTAIDTLIGDRIVRGSLDPLYQWASLGTLSKFFTIFMHSTVVYNRKVIPAEMLFYDARYVHAEDFDLFRRITDRFSAAMIGESLVAYRIHGESVTNKHKRQMRKTHLKIVAENLEREGLVDRSDVFDDIADAVTTKSVQQVAECILGLEKKISTQPAAIRPSYEEGTLNLFYFLYQLISDEQRPEFTHEFLTRTQKWGLIRRRERYSLLPGAYMPWFSGISIAANKRVDALSRYLQSVPAATVLPRSDLIG
ncbi:glycosyltransferase family 2 protein [Phyllobacterium zundukense]|uniref:Glycosyltransferase n=1 Tax=Phyllobacterium zundukense TaxID=1867719 RepID=A0ACD4CZB3_9HYPH|nr:glycosyltransferase family 2 protein [Phyllobacterium zundukense]UXN58874.1 glycosyltransferase [Phyllobacterium zundukense]